MRISGKVWGKTQLILANHVLEFHRITVKRGGYCSTHRHKYKWNGFFVESGELLIHVQKNDYDLTDTTVLRAGDFMEVKPGEFHSFHARQDTVAFELYYAEFDHGDIERKNHGGND